MTSARGVADDYALAPRSHSRTLALSHSRTLALSHSRTLALSHSRTSFSVSPLLTLHVAEHLHVVQRVVGPAADVGVGPQGHQRGHHPLHVQAAVDAGQVAQRGGGVAAHPDVGVAREVQAAALHVRPVVPVQGQAQQGQADVAPARGERGLGLVAVDGVQLLVDAGGLVLFGLAHRSIPSISRSAGATSVMARARAARSPLPGPIASTGTGFRVCPPAASSTLPWSLLTTSSASAGSAPARPPRKASTFSSAAM